jgi:hypothetical protein
MTASLRSADEAARLRLRRLVALTQACARQLAASREPRADGVRLPGPMTSGASPPRR